MQAELMPQNPSFCNKKLKNNRSNILGLVLALPIFQGVFKYIIPFDLHENHWVKKGIIIPRFQTRIFSCVIN